MTAAERSEAERYPAAPKRPPGAALIALYPAAWRRRYAEELAAVLEVGGLGLRDRIDLVRGAVDAHLHPPQPSMLPVAAALSAGALASAHAIAVAVQPAPLDWPGYLDEALPLAILSVALLIPSMIGLWLRLGDSDGALGRLGIVIALAGHGAWFVALVAAALRVEYGPLTAVASTVAMLGTAMLGAALTSGGNGLLGALLVLAALAGVAPPGLGWSLFAAAWSGIGFRLVLEARRRRDRSGGGPPALP